MLCIHSHTIPRALQPLNCVQCLVLFQPFEDSECHTGKVVHPFALHDTASIPFKYLAFILRGELGVVKHSAVLGIWHFFPNVHTVIFFYVRVYRVEEVRVDLVISWQTAEEKWVFSGNNYKRKGQWLP